MEHYSSYIGCEISEVPLSDAARKIMSALQSIPTGVQTSRKNNQSKEKTKEDKLGDKDAGLKNEKEITDSTVALLKSSASSEKRTAGEVVRTAHTKEILGCQDSKILSFYQELDSPKWRYRGKNLTVEERNMADGEKNLAAPPKRKQEVPTYCLGKKRLLVKKHISHERRYNWTSRQAEPSENVFCDIRSLGYEEKRELIANIKEAVAFVTTMIFLDGSSQLNSEQTLTSSVKGIVVLVKSRTDRLCSLSFSSTDSTWSAASQGDKFIYLETECSSLWEQGEQTHNKFARQVLFQILRCKVPVICFNAKDFLKTVLQVYGSGISWKQVADSIVLDPRIAAWLINSSDTVPSFECLLQYFEKSYSVETVNTDTGGLRNSRHQNLVVNLQKLYTIMMGLAHDLQVQGLWKLFCTLELPLIKVLAVMETHKIHVDKQELKKTSEILGVLFEKLKLHTLCEKIPRTERQQVASTSEVVLSKLQDLHPLPKLMLEYRQVRKMKSTYVDGLRTCMRKNIQGISKHPVRITKKQYIKGKEEEILTISPRALFVSKKGYTFLAADFSQIELRILADLSAEPELLKLFQEPETTDIFTSLASQWKGIPSEQVKQTDREQAKRIVYSVVYGAGKERLAECLGITPHEAGHFIESFMQKYKKVHEFTKKTIGQCQNKGYVVSIMGRKRLLANINSQDYKLRTQAERQAVNFVVQGSAADLCKMAMVEIFTSVVVSPTLTARLIAQIHDELLFEVEDSQIQEFSALVKRTMESLQQTTALEVPLKVPLKVLLTTGKSWGCMTELQEM
ncbi:HAUS augmin-like complex subunit 3 isoform X4 [Gallus gallus]|uniref:HAUS augmin-like complex subunit 3 isoform X4 n=1 Tax=Gallus gallus TaxID=9031 RepID=UPI001EFF7287|nr:HAUS augmin-like complex subunit 3 isoform X4 [Gallus gallus]